jgi:hypothetical protein
MIHRAYFVLNRLIIPAMLPEVSGSFPTEVGMGKSTRFQLVT